MKCQVHDEESRGFAGSSQCDQQRGQLLAEIQDLIAWLAEAVSRYEHLLNSPSPGRTLPCHSQEALIWIRESLEDFDATVFAISRSSTQGAKRF